MKNLPLHGFVRAWHTVVVVAVCGIAAFVLLLLRQPTDEVPYVGLGWPAYLAILLAAGGAPFAISLALRRRGQPAPDSTTDAVPAWLSPVTACTVLSIGIAALALLTYKLGSESALRSVRHRLEAVATLKASLIGAWMESEVSDLRVWTSSPEFTRLAEAWDSGSAADRDRLLDYLRRVSRTGHYKEVGLRAASTGKLLLTTTADADTDEVRRLAVLAASAPTPVLEDFHRDAEDDKDAITYLGLFSAAVTGAAGTKLVAHVGIDSDHEFVPLIEKWPGDTGTAEVLLMRSERDALVAVYEPRGVNRGKPARRIEVHPTGPTSAAVALGTPAFLRGVDDRSNGVLAFATPVDGTPWLLVAKIDEAEAFAERNRIAALTASIVIALLVLGSWRWTETRRRAAIEREIRREREAHAQRLSELSRRVVSVQEDERRRLAVELHDRTGGNLAAINMNLKSIAKALPTHDTGDDDLLRDTRDLLADTIVSIREFCGDLRPAVLDHAGLADALRHSVAQFTRRTGIAARIDDQNFSGRLAAEMESALFRIAQEALLNCAKHSQAQNVSVTLARTGERVTLRIDDDGVGFDPGRLGAEGQATSFGLSSMQERAAFADGSFVLNAVPGRGTQITVQVG